MLTRDELVAVFTELQDQSVLSVYVDADEHDPAERGSWRVRLEGEVSKVRRELDERGEDVGGFERAWALIDDRLKSEDGFSKRGWVAFATGDRLWYAEPVPARMPNLVRWQRGVRAAPYVRALKQQRPVTVVLVDARRARIFEQAEGEIQELEGLRADTDVGDLSDVGVRKGSSRASGMRGETSTDTARRALDVAAERMLKGLAALIDERSGEDGVVVVGGPEETARRLVSVLPRRLEGRVMERPALHLDMTSAQVREEVRSAAGDLREGAHDALVESVVDAARSGAKGALGKEATLRALDERRVDRLLLSRSFLRAHPEVADRCVALAFTQAAEVEEVSGAAGTRLDEEAGGIAARLRYGSAKATTA